MITLKKATVAAKGESVLILAKSVDSIPSNIQLTTDQKLYIKQRIADNEKRLVFINKLGHYVIFLQIDEKVNGYNSVEKIRKNASTVASVLNDNKIKEITVFNLTSNPTYSFAAAEGLVLGSYQFIRFKKDAKKEQNTLKSVHIIDAKLDNKEVETMSIILDATYKARDLVNLPLSHLNAVGLAKEIEKMGKESGCKVEVFNKSKIQSLKMGGLLSVNKGSIDPPTFTIMEWKPKNAKNKKPYVLVGKGVVYDTGGLSLKPTANSMDLMKCDMAGSATVSCAVYAIAKAKLPIHVIALVPATDNRPGGNAYAPGDVITMYDGTNVEMLNADAEGRMILADALSYAKKYNPELVLDFATLTGAAMAAIGPQGMVCMGVLDEKIKTKLKDSGNNVYERLAEFPFWEEYGDLIKSEIADIKNVGGPSAGAITAGKFLYHFTSYPWMHFDIAGPAFISAKDGYKSKGGTGVGVRFLFDFFRNI
ncbi:MAG: leucyl aminopeptidase family protein [Bacteroidetes bacterium]|nr:leucyl aminopeptidase family protein [Bacteroidota bacterium]